jgi:amino acid transporter
MPRLWNPYYALFYFLYRFCQINRKEDTPQVPAWILITLVSYFIVLFSVGCLEPVTHVRAHTSNLSRFQAFAQLAVLSVPHYFLTLYRRRYVEFMSRLAATPHREKVFNLYVILALILTPFLLFMIFVHFDIVHRPYPHI